MICGMCRSRPASESDMIGALYVCHTCYNEFAQIGSRKQLAKQVVAMDKELESDERLKVARAQLEVYKKRLRIAEGLLEHYGYTGVYRAKLRAADPLDKPEDTDFDATS